MRDQIKIYLQELMMNGELKFGERISLPVLAKKLNVSVTPVREALSQLQQVEIIEAIPNRGFFLPQPNIQKISELYPIIANLEYLGVSESTYTNEDIVILETLFQIENTYDNAVDRIQSDIKFHQLLLKNYQNNALKTILYDLKLRVFLYEFYYMENTKLAQTSTNYHKNVIAAIKKKDVLKAAELIRESWLTSIPFIEKHFNSRNDAFEHTNTLAASNF
ncbi:MAG: GntR family transcriptional regulator [Gelidibacter sp.]|nr:GntR family transcriptional regulator [Gelidibacter sp.]